MPQRKFGGIVWHRAGSPSKPKHSKRLLQLQMQYDQKQTSPEWTDFNHYNLNIKMAHMNLSSSPWCPQICWIFLYQLPSAGLGPCQRTEMLARLLDLQVLGLHGYNTKLIPCLRFLFNIEFETTEKKNANLACVSTTEIVQTHSYSLVTILKCNTFNCNKKKGLKVRRE